MKKLVSIFLVIAMIVFLANIAFAAEEEALTGQKAAVVAGEEGWKVGAEISTEIHNGIVDEISGETLLSKTVIKEIIGIGIEKGAKEDKTGLYVQVENFSPSEQELLSTYVYMGGYTKVLKTKIDVGVARYITREKNEADYYGIYALIDFPAPILKVVPFVAMEYRFSEKMENEDGTKTLMDGFLYRGGLKRDFELIHERVNLNIEISAGGNTGIYGMPAENISFAREKVDITISLTKWLKLRFSALTQQNLGLKEVGIAADTDRLFVSAAIVCEF